jgi:hemerythrin-like metal-binding protein
MTKKFIWTKKLSVGVKEIDEQHKDLIKIINETNLLVGGSYEDKVKEEVNELLAFARVHFTTEENYFKKWNYPFANEHIIEHEKLILKVLQFSQRFQTEGKNILKDFLLLLKDWLENHIKKHDFKYRDYIKNNRLI